MFVGEKLRQYALPKQRRIISESPSWVVGLLLADDADLAFVSTHRRLVVRYHDDIQKALLKKIKKITKEKPLTDEEKTNVTFYFNELLRINDLLSKSKKGEGGEEGAKK